ncbi:RNA polymerase sigma factor [Solitalea canadensis]|nr:sigma-70 family RNA polymerase sigma factor [Solitalea canadensis]
MQSLEEDFKIIEDIKNGDTNKYKILVEKYERGLFFHIYKKVLDRDIAEELTHECFIKAFCNLTKYKPLFNFNTWLYTIATNHSLDYLKKEKKFRAKYSFQSLAEESFGITEFATNTNNPELSLIKKQYSTFIRESLFKLPEMYSIPLRLRFIKEYTYDEICAELNLSMVIVKSRIFRGKRLLQEKLACLS